MTKNPALPYWAFVTPSYAGDYRRCLLLCRSMDHFLTGAWHHYIVVDRPHFAMFEHLRGPKRSVLLTENVVPGNMKLLFHLPFVGGRSVWWSRKTGLSIGWHLQQMVKIGIASLLSEQGLAYCDSDTFFVKPFNVESLTSGTNFRLYRVPQRKRMDAIWNASYVKAALALLGLPADGEYHTYIDNFVTWQRSTVLQMCNHLALKLGGPWQGAFRNRLQISEYALYGLYADEINAGRDHFHTNHSLCKTHWARRKLTDVELSAFCSDLAPHLSLIHI